MTESLCFLNYFSSHLLVVLWCAFSSSVCYVWFYWYWKYLLRTGLVTGRNYLTQDLLVRNTGNREQHLRVVRVFRDGSRQWSLHFKWTSEINFWFKQFIKSKVSFDINQFENVWRTILFFWQYLEEHTFDLIVYGGTLISLDSVWGKIFFIWQCLKKHTFDLTEFEVEDTYFSFDRWGPDMK